MYGNFGGGVYKCLYPLGYAPGSQYFRSGPHRGGSSHLDLPIQLRNPDITYGLFRRQLSRHTFSGSMNTMALCDFDMRRLRRTLTYLLTLIDRFPTTTSFVLTTVFPGELGSAGSPSSPPRPPVRGREPLAISGMVFSRAACPSCQPTISVKAPKGKL